jgi:hypothetical protein
MNWTFNKEEFLRQTTEAKDAVHLILKCIYTTTLTFLLLTNVIDMFSFKCKRGSLCFKGIQL